MVENLSLVVIPVTMQAPPQLLSYAAGVPPPPTSLGPLRALSQPLKTQVNELPVYLNFTTYLKDLLLNVHLLVHRPVRMPKLPKGTLS